MRVLAEMKPSCLIGRLITLSLSFVRASAMERKSLVDFEFHNGNCLDGGTRSKLECRQEL
ncbi:hypothetical protein T10_1466 [Trichinella papuae]|uniref:Uncharacterized protein n=1 Tax=Trichinella papuae TaxID=268474 RepID=A0A0V1M462_9BILA|nr:hypothetical protein T10_11597 [Trichinella papuae]KRZ65345.1 hypothetical protein T10_1225 [Trichinella papuae]KRZ65445.1 hypothetical protein T10_858 [Trichinella papuae]KRZ66567.1 hypothetical protein T10_1466 [Trichinella papuae]